MKTLLLAGAVMAAVGCASEPSAAVRVPVPKSSAEPDTPPTGSAEPTTTTEATTTTVEPTTTTTEPAPVTTAAPRRTTTTVPLPAMAQPTVHGGQAYGEWAIPAYIVMCESGGRWDAYNASGASGPYQIMPMHFGGELAMNQSRAAQHAMAAKLWNGGAGARNWAACL
jgi:hypothetical protein